MSTLTILQCLNSECWITVWSSTSIIDCCHLHGVACEWSQSSQHMLSVSLSCSVHNGGTIAVAQSVSSDGTSLVWAGYCLPHYTQWLALHWCASESSRSTSRGWRGYMYVNSCTDVRYHWCVVPAVKVLVEEVIVLLLPSTNTAVTLTVQLLPALREEMVWLLAVPVTVFVCTDGVCESHKSWQE